MAQVSFTKALKLEYSALFESCSIRSGRESLIERIISKMESGKNRYESAGGPLGVPWVFVASIHQMESSLNFTTHLHNGDPLTARTVHVPSGRPRSGTPPFSWEESAQDALTLQGLSDWEDWTVPGTLYQLERYNGWGYRLHHPSVLSPYLWSFSNHYKSGKYTADGTWSDTATSKQCGAAAILRRMAETDLIEFVDQPAPKPDSAPLVSVYSKRKSANPILVTCAMNLQRWLNTFPSIFVKVDGIPGKRTSDAYRKVVGLYLPGDPRQL